MVEDESLEELEDGQGNEESDDEIGDGEDERNRRVDEVEDGENDSNERMEEDVGTSRVKSPRVGRLPRYLQDHVLCAGPGVSLPDAVFFPSLSHIVP